MYIQFFFYLLGISYSSGFQLACVSKPFYWHPVTNKELTMHEISPQVLFDVRLKIPTLVAQMHFLS